MKVVALLYRACPLAALLYVILSLHLRSHTTLRSGYFDWNTEDLLHMTQNKTLGVRKQTTIIMGRLTI